LVTANFEAIQVRKLIRQLDAMTRLAEQQSTGGRSHRPPLRVRSYSTRATRPNMNGNGHGTLPGTLAVLELLERDISPVNGNGHPKAVTRRSRPVFGAQAMVELLERRADLWDPACPTGRKFNPGQPRDPEGKWIDVPGSGLKKAIKKVAEAVTEMDQPVVADLTPDDFMRPGENDTSSMINGAGKRLAAAWKPSEADLDAWIAEERLTEHYSGKSLSEKREGLARSTLKGWQGSSGGPIATAAITAVADRLGADYDLYEGEAEPQRYIRERPALRRPMESFGEAMYAQTQAWFAERGITHVQVKRVTWRGAAKDDRRPFTSWSAERSAGYVGEQTGSTERHESVPVARVFSIPPTGFGSLAEMEFVLLPPLPVAKRKGKN